MMLGAWFTLRMGTDSCRLVLLEIFGSLWRDAEVVRRDVCLDFLLFLSPLDDDVVHIAPNVDHTVKVAVGVIIVVALLYL